MNVDLVVNGRAHATGAAERLVDVLRGEVGVRSVREGCGEGACGSCVVLVAGIPRLSCLVLAGRVTGEVTTVEGLESDELLAEVVAELSAQHAVQCGYCAPGIVLETYAECVDARHDGSVPVATRVDRVLRDHVCRCSGYVRLRAGIAAVIGRTREGSRPCER